MKFDINNYKGKYVMHCKTEEEVRDFCDYMLHCGVDYLGSITFEMFDTYTCFNFNNKTSGHKDYYEKAGYTILEWSDFTTEFTKADLQNGMVIRYRNGEKRIILNSNIMGNGCFIPFEQMNDNLTHYANNDYDIIKVYRSSGCTINDYLKDHNLTLIWERKEKPEPVEMTIEEICKALGKEIKIVKG